jgi:hypothetical protein
VGAKIFGAPKSALRAGLGKHFTSLEAMLGGEVSGLFSYQLLGSRFRRLRCVQASTEI